MDRPLHEATPHPFPLPIRWGEGGRRSGEGMVHGPTACERRNGALHEPTPHPFPLPIRWGEGGRRSGEGWFMVPMHAEKRKGALHEPQRVGSIALASCPWTSVKKFQENEKLITPPLCAPFAPPDAPGEQPMNSSRAPQPSLHPDPLGRQHATSQQWAVDAPANSPRPRPYCRYPG